MCTCASQYKRAGVEVTSGRSGRGGRLGMVHIPGERGVEQPGAVLFLKRGAGLTLLSRGNEASIFANKVVVKRI